MKSKLVYILFIFLAFTAQSFAATTAKSKKTLSDEDACVSAEGYVTLKQPKYAVAAYEPMAKSGIACAQFGLGKLYLEGQGIAADKKKGYSLIHQASKSGYKPAKDFLKNNVD